MSLLFFKLTLWLFQNSESPYVLYLPKSLLGGQFVIGQKKRSKLKAAFFDQSQTRNNAVIYANHMWTYLL